MQHEPIGRIRPQGEKIRRRADSRKLCTTKHLLRHQAFIAGEVQLHWLHLVRQVGQHENGVDLVMAHIGEDFAIIRAQESGPTASERSVVLAQGNGALHPPQERGTIALLTLDIDRLVAIDRIHDHRQIQPLWVSARKPGVAVA